MTSRELVLSGLRAGGAFSLSRRLTRKKLRVLCYHGLWLGGAPHYGDCLYMDPRTFEARMEWLAESGYPVLPFDEALRRLDDGTLPDNAVSITIDDGWYSTYVGMVPVLSRLNLPATLYVTTYYAMKGLPVLNVLIGYLVDRAPDEALHRAWPNWFPDASPAPARGTVADRLSTRVDRLPLGERWSAVEDIAHALSLSDELNRAVSRRLFHLMTENEIRETAHSGMDVQLHTHTHRMHGFDPTLIADDINRNRDELARILAVDRRELRHFCFPSGVHSDAIFSTLQVNGIASATTTEFGLVDRETQRMAMPRILDCQSFGLLDFEARVSGFWHLMTTAKHHLRQS